MKKSVFVILFGVSVLIQLNGFAQDRTKPGAVKTITRLNTRADELNGKKIQRQTLSNNHVERLETTAVKKTKKKHGSRKKNVHPVIQQ